MVCWRDAAAGGARCAGPCRGGGGARVRPGARRGGRVAASASRRRAALSPSRLAGRLRRVRAEVRGCGSRRREGARARGLAAAVLRSRPVSAATCAHRERPEAAGPSSVAGGAGSPSPPAAAVCVRPRVPAADWRVVGHRGRESCCLGRHAMGVPPDPRGVAWPDGCHS